MITILNTSEEYHALEELVLSEDGHKEIECGRFLKHVLGRLLNRTPIAIISVNFEDRNYFGSSDLTVSAKFKGDAGREETIAYIWEIKAPQCYLMTPDGNQRRFCPTSDFYKAENQLIHYVHEARHNNIFRDRFKVGATGKVSAGGIIIGRDDKITRLEYRNYTERAHDSLDIRRSMLHQSEGFRILTWTRILEFMQPSPIPKATTTAYQTILGEN